MPPLTNTRHERFCAAIIQGNNQTDAYLAGGYKVSKETAWRNASRLLRKAEVVARLDELKKRKTADSIGDVDERKSHLTEIYRTPAEGGRNAVTKQGHRIAAIAEQNRMEGIGSQGTDVNVFVPIQFERAERRDYQDED